MFGIEKEDLKDLLANAHKGSLQLPDFQRDYVWTDEDVRSLIASIAKGYPVGALLTLKTGGSVDFKSRTLEGVPATSMQPEELLLDGQQRMTSLYQAAYSRQPVWVKTNRDTKVSRLYYIDIQRALLTGADLEDAIVAVPADGIIRTNFGRDVQLDLSSPEKEFEHHMFPLNQVFDSRDWFYKWRDHWKVKGQDVTDLERDFDQGVVDQIARYKMPVIRLDKKNTREAICLVFEKVNVGGKKLDAFELLTAIYASAKFDLREDWNGAPGKADLGRRARLIGAPNRRDVLTQVASTDFLQACTLLHTREVRLARKAAGGTDKDLPQISCKRDALLGLPLNGYRTHAESVEKGFIEAGTFLNEHKIIWHKDVPYPPLVVGLAATFAILGKEAQNAAAKAKIARWFWSVTLGELFGSSTESRLARDVPELVDWVRDAGPEPRALAEAVFQQERLNSLRMRLSAAYKGLHALMMRHGCRDFVTGRPTDIMTFFNDRIDIHHIFPQRWCRDKGIPPERFNAIINKTPLSKLSNIEISGDAPSVYLQRIEDTHRLTRDQVKDILRSHLIDPDLLYADDFDGFYESRKVALAGIVTEAMGKSVVTGITADEAEQPIFGDTDEEEAA